MSSQVLEGKVAVVTGAGRGLGRAEALALAAHGAAVVVNDIEGPGGNPAQSVVEEITAAGGRAVAVTGDIGDFATSGTLVDTAVAHFGSLDIVVNNAGFLRDKMIFSMSEQEWDQVLRVHLKGHFALCRHATAYWREKSKQAGGEVYARIINTASEASLMGSAGQPNYAAAKGGITSLTLSIHNGAGRYGVRANVLAPRARTDMTAKVFGAAEDTENDPLSPDNVAPLVVFLASPAAEHISGQVFVAYGGMVVLMAAPTVDARFDAPDGRWSLEGLADSLGKHVAARDPGITFAAAELYRLSAG